MAHPRTLPIRIEPFDLYLFGRGEHWDLYRLLGAHLMAPIFAPDSLEADGRPVPGCRFSVWAPNAKAVSVVGDFNDWAPGEHPLYLLENSGVWAGFIPGVEQGAHYKYAVRRQDGGLTFKTDPFAFWADLRPGSSAVVWPLDGYEWGDGAWMERRRERELALDQPLSIYEVHAGSWRKPEPRWDSFFNYRELADQLIPYVKELGFTHIEFMPLAEHPLDESWGYQVGCYFAPTSRFGKPEDLKYLVDQCHQAGLGVILDWAPAHFPKDDWALGRFDGTALYEHADPRQGEHPEWGTYVFNYGRNEARNFLLSNALYWLKEFHVDGLRLDAVASMLYLDYSRLDGQWIPNCQGGNENLEAMRFLQELNVVVHGQYPGAIMVAEESTAWTGVSRPAYLGGLGFTYKWNMGWMNDALEYFSKEPIHRSYQHNNLTFSMLYAFTENFILPLSHDEVVHGKRALLSKMPGDDWQKFANLRALYAYMWGHPGKKLLFMGGEFGQWKEWSCAEPLDWALLDFPSHRGLMRLVADLNQLLREEPAMHEFDNDWCGFEWVDFSDYNASVISFLRKSKSGDQILWVYNFTPVVRRDYGVGCRAPGVWREVLNSDAEIYGGSNVGNAGAVVARSAEGQSAWPYALFLTLPPLAAIALKPETL